jgi:hypothetical protein
MGLAIISAKMVRISRLAIKRENSMHPYLPLATRRLVIDDNL